MGRPDLPEQICDPEGFGEEPELQECCRRNCSLQGVRRALSKSARRRREGALTRAIRAEGLLGALRARETRAEGSSGTAPTRETRRTIGDSFKVERIQPTQQILTLAHESRSKYASITLSRRGWSLGSGTARLFLWLLNHTHKPAKPYPQATGHSRCAYWVLLTKATLPGLVLKTAFPGLLFGGCWKGQTIPKSNFGASKTPFRIIRGV